MEKRERATAQSGGMCEEDEIKNGIRGYRNHVGIWVPYPDEDRIAEERALGYRGCQ